MASVMPPIVPHHPIKFRAHKARAPSVDPSSSSARSDPFYGHQELACISAHYVSHLFSCPSMPPTSNSPQAKLPYFIAYAIHRTKLHPSVTYAALVLLSRLKARFPSAKGSSGHRLFISSFMIASKVLCDDTYSNKSWSVVAQNLFALKEINQMEHEMVNYLDFELNVDAYTLSTFEAAVKRDFGLQSRTPYPTYPLEMISKRARDAKNAPPPPSREGLSIDTSYLPEPIPLDSPHDEVPPTPDSSSSTSTSPASTPSPETPIDCDSMEVAIEGGDGDLCLRREAVLVKHVPKIQYSKAAPSFW